MPLEGTDKLLGIRRLETLLSDPRIKKIVDNVSSEWNYEN